MPLWAMSFPTWLCCDKHCRNEVQWVDAYPVIVDGRVIGFRHLDCDEEAA
jgi:hypothetical protein